MSKLSEYAPAHRARLRHTKDRLATAGITAGGAGVLLAILLIFFYLLYEVVPLFSGAGIEAGERTPWNGPVPAYLAVEEQGEVGFAVAPDGAARFFDIASGAVIETLDLAGDRAAVTVVAAEAPQSRLLALGHADGGVSLARHDYKLSYPGGEREITPELSRPYADQALSLGRGAVTALAVSDTEDALVVVGEVAGEGLRGTRFRRQESFLTGETTLEEEALVLPTLAGDTAALFIGSGQRWLYRIDSAGDFTVVDLQRSGAAGALAIAATGKLFEGGGGLSTSAMLLGGISLLAASDRGELVQYFMVRDEQSGHRFHRVRDFDTRGVVVARILPEHRRKGFLALGRDGELQIYHTTAHRRLYSREVGAPGREGAAAIAPRGDALIYIGGDGQLAHWAVDNEHPDVSWSALWDEVWYESYDEPAHIWQSSASNNDFEPKYSFAPLAFGTLKAAFYTMLIAAPLAICGAIYTAYFMAPALRRKIKPMIELMEALPTVILGFLAGLWLAPFIEDKLTGVFALLVFMPLGILSFAFAFSRLPVMLRRRVPEGWDAAILLPVVVLIGYLSFAANDPLELALFGGDMRLWITRELGISFDQRNSLVVGIAMGMAVIPTIFSIAEDAIFSVPRHLSDGSLALGATPWQTLVGVVLPTASPGIFSGLMIGLGRAVGETMIVLMATGNTPIMDANIFEGMRTLSANIAVEVPEAEVDSTHYRVLFLAAFVLLLFTFVFNTIAELVRQRLRVKYGSL
ncbi:ABC transporter permease subunit [Parahaliea mediterranea]|uniref:ABC transporter permease subunit n=1 Tax=Parahaliea mediterranea TaxID=651086 RepID=A0A939IM19_9GAMM|nr:ABC transporter permease subunit [Parahaliea mediterranea]MBN7798961.1 ABC transporter permease subunit [Parahaliea mediterranea]